MEERVRAASRLIVPENNELTFDPAAGAPSYFDFDKLFGRGGELRLEIGCGKGQFVCQAAAREPDVNFLAVEKLSNVIVSGCELAEAMGLDNIRFVRTGAEYLTRYIPAGLVNRIYLNFSCPYPKARYAGHRLTAPAFLDIYKKIMADGAEIHQKTDNARFFEYSVEQLSAAGFRIKNVSLDLHQSGFEGNIITEYEARFASQGKPIYRLEAVK